ncbi:MAG: sugar phosphate isomerase/epimerase [Firmicutes bacterium]|nr:sugar phosphate isomerase/epimerase [Bacillota bacterium]
MEIGAQLYTVRDFCKNLDDFSETLKKVAEIGYKNVQISGTCDYTAEWLSEKLRENGLKCVLTHIPQEQIIADPKKVCDAHTTFGCKYVGLGYYNFKEKTVDDFCSLFLEPAKTITEDGKYFMYHNHDIEFIKKDGKLILDQLAERFPSEIMGFTLDTFWIQVGGGDPGYWIEKLTGRVPCIHLKDYSFGREMAVIGEGNINFERVFEKAETAGTQYMLVEQDECNGENPFDCLKRSYEYLKAQGF